MGQLFDKTISALKVSLDMRELRNNITSANIANASTPGYKAKKMDFENALSYALNISGTNRLETDGPGQFSSGSPPVADVQPDVYDNPVGPTNNDGNTVDMEHEMATLAQNSILYKAAVELINKKLANLRYVVTEGGK